MQRKDTLKTDWNEFNKWMKRPFWYQWFLNSAWNGYKGLLKHVEIKKSIKVLELGGGSGFLSLKIAQLFDTKKVTIIDLNEKNLEISKRNLSRIQGKKEYILGDFFEFNPNEKYDIVHSQGVVEHFDQSQRMKLIEKHFNLTKHSGYTIIFVPTPTLSYKLFRKIADMTGHWIFHDEVPMKLAELQEIVGKSNREIISVSYFWPFFLTEVGILCKAQ